jgi:hypothetical protein
MPEFRRAIDPIMPRNDRSCGARSASGRALGDHAETGDGEMDHPEPSEHFPERWTPVFRKKMRPIKDD